MFEIKFTLRFLKVEWFNAFWVEYFNGFDKFTSVLKYVELIYNDFVGFLLVYEIIWISFSYFMKVSEFTRIILRFYPVFTY